MSPHERREMVSEMMDLPPTHMSEAISRIMPFTVMGPAKWMVSGSEEALELARAHAKAMRSRPDLQRADIRETPWKTGWMRPRPYEPIIRYNTSWGGERIFEERS